MRSQRVEAVLTLHTDESLIGVVHSGGDEVVADLYACDDNADVVVDSETIQADLDLAGVWSDIDADEMLEELTRIRHSNPPSMSRSI